MIELERTYGGTDVRTPEETRRYLQRVYHSPKLAEFQTKTREAWESSRMLAHDKSAYDMTCRTSSLAYPIAQAHQMTSLQRVSIHTSALPKALRMIPAYHPPIANQRTTASGAGAGQHARSRVPEMHSLSPNHSDEEGIDLEWDIEKDYRFALAVQEAERSQDRSFQNLHPQIKTVKYKSFDAWRKSQMYKNAPVRPATTCTTAVPKPALIPMKVPPGCAPTCVSSLPSSHSSKIVTQHLPLSIPRSKTPPNIRRR